MRSLVLKNGMFGGTPFDIGVDSVANFTAASDGGEEIDLSGLTVFPGFIDVHNHGANGFDVNSSDADSFIAIGEFLAKHGVTAWMPTLVPDSDENYRRVINAIDEVMLRQNGMPIAQIAGVHYEGVFANEKMCGALRPEYFKKFTGGELNELPRLKSGVHMTTFAPEIEGGVELAKELSRQGWIASIGHTKASVEILDAAFEAGARHVTHFFNAMSSIHHREIGVAGWTLANKEVSFDIIADGEHVTEPMLDLACRVKTPDKVSLISDSIAPTGLGDGDFQLWDENIKVKDGITQNERGSIAGSVITMNDAVKRMRKLKFSDGEVAMMSSRNPAKLLGIEKTYGSVEIGKRADLVAIDDLGEIVLTIIGGKIVYRNV
jgi:N-acetylglucosamine-6-phosphate deacetylase